MMRYLFPLKIFCFLLLMSLSCQASNPYLTLFESALKKETIPEHFLELTESFYNNFKLSESFEKVVLDTTEICGYINLQFSMPDVNKDVLKDAWIRPRAGSAPRAFSLPHKNVKETYDYEHGLLDASFSADQTLNLRLKVYEDGRKWQSMVLWGYYLPSKINHFEKRHLHRYLFDVLHVFFADWMALSQKNPEFNKLPFSSLMQRQIFTYLRSEQSRFLDQWKKTNALVEKTFPGQGIAAVEEKLLCENPSIDVLTNQVIAFNKCKLDDAFDPINTKLQQLQCLLGSPSEEGLKMLFQKKRTQNATSYEFPLGRENLAIYFSRLNRLSAQDLRLECQFLIKDFTALIPSLLSPKNAQFMADAAPGKLDLFASAQLANIQDQLTKARTFIHAISPGSDSVKIKKQEKTAKIVPLVKFEQKPTAPAHKKESIEDLGRLASIFSHRAFLDVFSTMIIPGYPIYAEHNDSIYITFPNKDTNFYAFLDDYLTCLTASNKKSQSRKVQRILLETKANGIKSVRLEIKQASQLHSEDVRKLKELWASSMIRYLREFAPEPASKEMWLFLEEATLRIVDSLSVAAKILGIPEGEKKPAFKGIFKAKPTEKINDFLTVMEQIRMPTIIMLKNPDVNATLLQMIIDLTSLRSFEVFKPGALQFITAHEHEISPYLLSIFTEWYYFRMQHSGTKQPLGINLHNSHANLLGAMLLQTCKEGSLHNGANREEKTAQFAAFVEDIATTLQKVKNLDFKV